MTDYPSRLALLRVLIIVFILSGQALGLEIEAKPNIGMLDQIVEHVAKQLEQTLAADADIPHLAKEIDDGASADSTRRKVEAFRSHLGLLEGGEVAKIQIVPTGDCQVIATTSEVRIAVLSVLSIGGKRAKGGLLQLTVTEPTRRANTISCHVAIAYVTLTTSQPFED